LKPPVKDNDDKIAGRVTGSKRGKKSSGRACSSLLGEVPGIGEHKKEQSRVQKARRREEDDRNKTLIRDEPFEEFRNVRRL